jgi:hypothetical protein
MGTHTSDSIIVGLEESRLLCNGSVADGTRVLEQRRDYYFTGKIEDSQQWDRMTRDIV